VNSDNDEIYIPSDDPRTEFRKGTRVLYKGRLKGEVTGIDEAFFGPPFLYVTLDDGVVVLAPLHDLQNINDNRQG
jgi:preprotein translocase subunit YajC